MKRFVSMLAGFMMTLGLLAFAQPQPPQTLEKTEAGGLAGAPIMEVPEQLQGLTEEQLRGAYEQLGAVLQQMEQQRIQQQQATQQAGQQAFAERIQALERQNLQRTLFEAQQRLRNLAADIEAGRNPEQAAQEIDRIVRTLNAAGILAQELEQTNQALGQLDLLRQQVIERQETAATTLNQIIERLQQQADVQARAQQPAGQREQAAQARLQQQAQLFAQIPQVQQRIQEIQQALQEGNQEQARELAQELETQFEQFRQAMEAQAGAEAQMRAQAQAFQELPGVQEQLEQVQQALEAGNQEEARTLIEDLQEQFRQFQQEQ